MRGAGRLWAWLRGKPPPPAYEIGGIAIEGVQTKGAMASDIAPNSLSALMNSHGASAPDFTISLSASTM